MIRYIEADGRVYRVRVARSRRRPTRWRLAVTVERGPGLDPGEADRLTARLVAKIVAAGGDVVRWAAGPGGD